MKRTPVSRWFSGGFFGLIVVALIGLPALSATASFGEGTVLASFFTSSQNETLSTELESPAPVTISPRTAAIPAIHTAVAASTISAVAATRCQLGDQGVEQARSLIYHQEYQEADALLTTLIDDQCIDDTETRDMARFQHAYLLHMLERHDQVLERLDALEADSPVDDYIAWLQATALEEVDRHGEAADRFATIYEQEDSPLHWKARARQTKALVVAERWEEALPIAEYILDTFPDYPRRHRLLYYHGKILEELQRPEDAAAAYQKAHFEFPYKQEGQQSKSRLQALSAQGVAPTPIDPQIRYEKYHQLSVDKFWPLAHQLMTDLRDEIATPNRGSELENALLQRIALNTYHRHDFDGAAEYFRQARDIFEDGFEDGFSESLIYRYHSFSLARIGRYDEARDALETLHDGSVRDGKQAVAELYERYGRYEEAYNLYDDIYTARQKRGWHFSYLRYKTGRFEDAYESLRRLARLSRGETRAKYLYWSARSMERSGNDTDAAELFAEIFQSRPNSYYGLQSANRLDDLTQRSTFEGAPIAQADRISNSVDQVFDIFDSAAPVSSSGAVYNPSDPRTLPVREAQTEHSDKSPRNQEFAGGNDCTVNDSCAPRGLGLPFPTYGLTWHHGQSLVDARVSSPIYAAYDSENSGDKEQDSIEGLDHDETPEVQIPRHDVEFPGEDVPRVRYSTEGRIYWHGRHDSEMGFVNYDRGEMIGPTPEEWTAYDDDTHHGGLQQAIDEGGDLFPELKRTQWLWTAGWTTEARRSIRDVALEFRSLSSRSRPSSSPHELPQRRWAYQIDNRRRAQRADYWGMSDNERRFPIPADSQGRQELLERQQSIHEKRRDLESTLVKAFQEVGEYHLVRQHSLRDTWWLRVAPEGNARRYWAMAYPRAYPEKVIPLAKKHNVNPYMIWALMLVESSFNPDSISIANAKGLLQVIPRTGLKIAALFGAEDFGPFDLLEADNSIEQGIFYFSRLVEKFHGQELMAFAGYNGGPHRVGGWLDMRGHNISLDEFVEEIPFNESRGYAKKVLRFLNVYLRIYEGYDDGLYVGQNVRPDYLEQPDF